MQEYAHSHRPAGTEAIADLGLEEKAFVPCVGDGQHARVEAEEAKAIAGVEPGEQPVLGVAEAQEGGYGNLRHVLAGLDAVDRFEITERAGELQADSRSRGEAAPEVVAQHVFGQHGRDWTAAESGTRSQLERTRKPALRLKRHGCKTNEP